MRDALAVLLAGCLINVIFCKAPGVCVSIWYQGVSDALSKGCIAEPNPVQEQFVSVLQTCKDLCCGAASKGCGMTPSGTENRLKVCKCRHLNVRTDKQEH